MFTPILRSSLVLRRARRFQAAASMIAFTIAVAMAQPCFAASTENGFDVIEVGASDGSGRKLLVNLMRPPGSGPFPLAVINHGSPVASKRAEMQIPKFTLLSRWLLAQGYAVALPLRRGYGAVGGRWDETYGPCGRPDFTRGGLETARDIRAVIDSLSRSDFVRKQGVVVFGQSAGGWGTLALASQNPTNVAGYINFAGGRGGHRNDTANDNCAPDLLVQAAGEYGRTTRRPSLWIYTENDSYFAPALVRQMHSRFVSSGGQAALHILPAVGSDGHQAISNETAFALWSPVVGRFLESLK